MASSDTLPTPIILSPADWKTLLEVARHAIKYGLTYKFAPQLELDKYNNNIKQIGASFVTLKESNVLRGCIGSVKPHLPLVQDVANHAFAAAFKDSRFASINHIEEPVVHISISVLSPPKELLFTSEQDLIQKIEKLKCGVILSFQNRDATFLPDVWNEVVDGADYLARLKQSLDLPKAFWSNDLSVAYYQVQSID